MHEAVFDYAAGRTYSNDVFPSLAKKFFSIEIVCPAMIPLSVPTFLGDRDKGGGPLD